MRKREHRQMYIHMYACQADANQHTNMLGIEIPYEINKNKIDGIAINFIYCHTIGFHQL